MDIDVYADLVCPWCHIGRAHLRTALARLGDPPEVTVRFRSFQLDPGAPSIPLPLGVTLAARYGADRVPEMLTSVAEWGRAAGAPVDLDATESLAGNTLPAHRIAHAAWEAGVQDSVVGALYKAHFEDRRSIFNAVELQLIGESAGLEPDQVEAALTDARFAQQVADDQAAAARLGIAAVPFFVLDGTQGIAGAQSVPVLTDVLGRMLDGPAAA